MNSSCSLAVPLEEDVDHLVDRRGVHVDLPGVLLRSKTNLYSVEMTNVRWASVLGAGTFVTLHLVAFKYWYGLRDIPHHKATFDRVDEMIYQSVR